MWQFEQAVHGSRRCVELGIPVTGATSAFYNQRARRDPAHPVVAFLA